MVLEQFQGMSIRKQLEVKVMFRNIFFVAKYDNIMVLPVLCVMFIVCACEENHRCLSVSVTKRLGLKIYFTNCDDDHVELDLQVRCKGFTV